MRVRIKFAKTGSLRYVGHLDFMRAVQKIIRRSSIEAAYTKGFSPHHILSFASPLGVGLESTGEYFDLELAYRDPFEMDKADLSRLNSIGLENDALPDVPSSEWILARLNREAPEGVRFLGMRRVGENSEKAMALVRAADYTVFLESGAFAGNDAASLLNSFLAQKEIIVHKVTKKTESDIDIRPLIFEASVRRGSVSDYSLQAAGFIEKEQLAFSSKPLQDTQARSDSEAVGHSAQDYSLQSTSLNEQETLALEATSRICQEGYPIIIDMALSAGSAANLKPETVVEAMCAFANIPYDPFSFRILRREMYMEGGMTLLDKGISF
ncbi:MAG: TIGR03936 family radical SAM-associated protein [Lachnospiraceae bacterium]|nr:TIGR03936 family radical SAM-associated protein [Lachnospiraceae bacterium]